MYIAPALLIGLVLLALYVFLDIQYYLASPDHAEYCDRWFKEFSKYNKERYEDPELSWRYSAIEEAFYKHEGLV